MNDMYSAVYRVHDKLNEINTFLEFSLKFGHSEKDTKFEKIFRLKFDVTHSVKF